MADELYPKLILLGVFCGVTTFLFMAIAPIVQSGAYMKDPSSYYNTIDIPGESFMAPQPFAVTNGTVKDHWDSPPSATFTGAVPGRNDILTCVVRGNDYLGTYQPRYYWANDFEDCLLFEMNYGIFNTKHKHAAISFEAIADNFDLSNNYSRTDIILNTDYTVFVSTGPGYSFPTALYVNAFNISIGWMWNMSQAVNPSPWALIGQILTFSVPDVGYTMNYIIGIPVYLTFGFLILAVVSRFFPTVPGL
ncbi:hypothetical protein KKF61_08395 [Patescibacteria group bacterium]|nr:hypothetical protein [Patescibacteria group bacterium]